MRRPTDLREKRGKTSSVAERAKEMRSSCDSDGSSAREYETGRVQLLGVTFLFISIRELYLLLFLL